MPIPSDFSSDEAAAFEQHGVGGLGPDAGATVVAGGGADTVTADVLGAGASTVTAGGGTDTLVAAAGADTLTGGQAADVVAGAPPPGYVPHAAMHAERTRAQDLARQNSLLMARTNAILAARTAPQVDPNAPTLETDPVAYIQTLEQRLEAFEQERQQDAQHRELDMALESDEQNFIAYTPDYPQASEYYVASRARELLQFHTPQDAQRIMTEEVRAIAKQSWERGMPAAQGIYQLAGARGYRPGQPSPFAAPAPTVAPAPAPVAAAPAPTAPVAAPSAAAVVDSVIAGQQASRSLSTAPGGGGAAELNAEALLKMNDEEFEAYLKLGTRGANDRFAAVAGR